MCVLVLLYFGPRTTIYVSEMLNVCPRTTIFWSSYYYICVLMSYYIGEARRPQGAR
jgi:hypothetical protein